MRRVLVVVVGAALAAAAVFACGAPKLSVPPYTGHPTSALVEVPYPPPPARVEVVPERPKGDPVWIDGEWTWQGRRWGWKSGRWVPLPASARFSPWTAVRDRAGTLFIAAGMWRDAKGAEVVEPRALAIGRPTLAEVVSTEGDDVIEGAPVAIDAGLSAPGSERDAAATRAAGDLDASRAEAGGTMNDALPAPRDLDGSNGT